VELPRVPPTFHFGGSYFSSFVALLQTQKDPHCRESLFVFVELPRVELGSELE